MSETTNDVTGKFCWYEYMGDDIDAAAKFYGEVVGWTIVENGMAGFRYLIAQVGTYGVAGLMTLSPEIKAMGTPACWTGYVWVADVDKAIEKLTSLGGSVKRPPSDIPNVGRFAVVADPGGAVFIIFRDAGGNPPPPPDPRTAGLVGWHELMAVDGQQALAFYGEMFGWTKDADVPLGPTMTYHLFSTGRGDSGGMMTKPSFVPAACWQYYFTVDGIDAAAKRVTEAGGKVINGPMEVPGGSFVLHGLDTQGAFFALVSLNR